MANSSSDRKKEEDLYNSWINNQQEELKELQNAIVARKNELNDDELNELLRKMVNNFQEYANGRSRLARIDVSPFFAPTWCTQGRLLVMLLWSYFSVVFTDPGSVPPNWKPDLDEERDDTDPLTASEFGASPADSTNPRVRFCKKCNQLKPPRCHHCSVCGRCVLKMDHHCVWVVNCVGALNYKYFLLFLFYTFLETTLVTLSLLPQFIAFFSDGEIPGTPGTLATTFLAFVFNLAFSLSVLGFLIMHISLVAGNTTTIEAYEKKTTPKWRYDLGRKRNFEQVFGLDKQYWFIPSYSEEDLRRMPALHGLEYPSKPELESQEF